MLKNLFSACSLFIISCCILTADVYSQSSISSSTIVSGTGTAATLTYGTPTRARNGPCKPGTSICSSTGTGQITTVAGTFPSQAAGTTTVFMVPAESPGSCDSFGNLYMFLKLGTVRPTTSDTITYDWLHNAMRNGYLPTKAGYWQLPYSLCTTLGPVGTTGISSSSDNDYSQSNHTLNVYWSARNSVNIVDNDTTQVMITFYGVVPGYALSISFSTDDNNNLQVSEANSIGSTMMTNRVYYRWGNVTSTSVTYYLYMDTLDIIYENSDPTQQANLKAGIRTALAAGQFPFSMNVDLSCGGSTEAYQGASTITAGSYPISQVPNTEWFTVTVNIPISSQGEGFAKPKNNKKPPPKKK